MDHDELSVRKRKRKESGVSEEKSRKDDASEKGRLTMR